MPHCSITSPPWSATPRLERTLPADARSIDVRSIAEHVVPSGQGYWQTPSSEDLSYPPAAHDRCNVVAERSFWFQHRNRVLLACLHRFPPAAGVMLDVGGGNGYIGLALQAHGIPTVLIEPARQAAANAVRRGMAHVIRGTAEGAGVRAASAGGIGLFDVLEHIEDDVGFLDYLRTRLVPAGRLYITVPALRSLWSDADVTAGHWTRYRTQELADVARRAGLEIEYCSYFFWCLPPVIWLFRKRRRRAPGSITSEHAAQAPALAACARMILAPELAWIRRSRAIPFGGSCLLVARARA